MAHRSALRMVSSSKFRAGLIASAALSAVSSGAFADVPAGFDFDARWGAWGEIGATYGTEESSYGEIAIFAPLWQDPDSLLFTEIRGKYFESEILEGNAMLGARQMTASGFNLGAWAGLDVRHTDSDNTFGQVSGGLEALSTWFDARVNGYLPFTDPQTAGAGMADVILEGSNIFMIGGEEVALYGVDGEIGGRLPLNGNRASLGVYGGGFWFDHEDIDEAIAGGKARVELAFNDVVGAGSRFSAEYTYTDDNVRGERHLIGARLRIPLGAAPPASSVSPQWLRMADRIERDVDIVVGGSGQEPVEDAITGVDFDQVAFANDGTSLQDGINTGGNTLIILDGANNPVAGNKTLNADQTLQGGGSTIQVRGLESGAIGNFTAPGSRPTIDFDDDAPVLRVADRTHLAGLDITGSNIPANSGVAGVAGIFAAFTDLDVSGVGGDGFTFSNAVNSTVIFRDVSVSDTGSAGIFFGNAAGAVVDFTDVWVSDTGGTGIAFSNADNAVVDFTNVWVSDTGLFGINFDGADGATATFTDVTFAGTIGDSGNNSDALILSSGDPLPTLNGDIADETNNDPDFCHGDFTGTLVVDGVPMTGANCL